MKKPLLIDLDGVLRLGKTPAPGIHDFFDYLRNSSRPSIVISNTTLSHAASIQEYFKKLKIEVPIEIMTASDAANLYVRKKYSTAAVFCSDEVAPLFSDILNYTNPEVVVMGDRGKDWDFAQLNRIFRLVKGGAEFIAMQKNKFWRTPEDGLLLDLGPFVKAVEYAAGKEALLIGKPSGIYFKTALEKIAPDYKDDFYMIGDDIETDIKGAQNSGGKGILIMTGKTEAPVSDEIKNIPEFIVDDLYQTVELLEKLP